jgi:hypothetical protein
MSQIEENTVYMILYNYQDADYSVVKIMNSLQKALTYIHTQEITKIASEEILTLVVINTEKDIIDNCKKDCYNVCLFHDNDSYMSRNFCDIDHISSYIIVKKTVE